MKITKSKKECCKSSPLSRPNRTDFFKLNLKSKSRKKVKNKELNCVSQLIPSACDSKISYLHSACGVIECIDSDNVHNQAQNIQNRTFTSSPKSSEDLKNDKCSKPQKRIRHKFIEKQKSGKDHHLSNSSLKNSIVKMTCPTDDNLGNSILQLYPDNRKSDNRDFAVLESLLLTGSETKKSTIVKNDLKNRFKENEICSTKNSNHSLNTIENLSPSSNTGNGTNNRANDFSNNPVCSIVVKSNGKNSVANFYELGCSKFIVVMKPESNLVLLGMVEIQLIKGSLEILGYNFYKEDETLLVFSLLGSSHLSVKAKHEKSPVDILNKSLLDKLIALGLSEVLSRKLSKKAENNVLFIVSKCKADICSTVWPKFFEHHSPYFVFPYTHLFDSSRPCNIVERKIKCLFETNLQELGLKEFNILPEWSAIETDVVNQDFSKVILCGGKSVGKSSLLRYLVNRCLFKWHQVLVLDFDLGQCEFTVPGCISVSLVEEPLLGPNYSHLKEPRRCVFLGEVDVTKCPENYIEGCKSLIDYARHEHSNIPWLVNTMGFNKGFGVSLACGIINYVSPSHVIQIQSRDRKLNFPSLLEPKFVNCLKHSAFDVEEVTLNYQLHTVPSGSEQPGFISKLRGISPAESRNLVILSYMSRMLSSHISSLSQVTPYKISMDQLDLQTTNKYNLSKAQVAASMNGNMVALCHNTTNDKFLNCRGFGIVRAVDWKNGTLFLITPLPHTELSKVNCLAKGNIGLPDSLYYNQGDQVTGHVPYLAHTSGGSTARFAKRDFRSLPVTQKDNRQYQ